MAGNVKCLNIMPTGGKGHGEKGGEQRVDVKKGGRRGGGKKRGSVP